MIIQFDVDGVLADFMGHAYKRALQIDPTIPYTDTHTTKDWDHWEGWSSKVISEVWKTAKDEQSLFYYTMPSLIDRADWMGIRRLINNRSNQIYFVTSRPGPTAKWQTESWLFDRLETQSTVIISADKAGFAKLLDVDWSIEDNSINAAKIAQHIGVERSCLINRLYNQNLHPRSCTRLKTLKEFLALVEKSISGSPNVGI